jgi:glycosyltransferase involved in cell wall biosynthesis
LRAGLDFICSDFAVTKAHLVGGIDETRRLAALIGELGARIVALRDAAEARPSAEDLRCAANDVAALASGMESLKTHMEGGKIALDRLSENLEDLRRNVQPSANPSAPATVPRASDAAVIGAYRRELEALRKALSPVPFGISASPSAGAPLAGKGVYVRTDYWAQLVSGGSYGHTCYVAKELAAVTRSFACLMASDFALLRELDLAQRVIRPPFQTASETELLAADPFYHEALRRELQSSRPAYIYERLCLGNFAAARLSRELGIPYILEYNGSELSMRRSFGSGPYEHEDLFLEAEELAFKQATAITVISEHVRSDVINRGVDPAKVLTNPNGVDCQEYAPAPPAQRREIRASLGISDEPVIGFIGTFGGWHGIDVLAAALPIICRLAPSARFLLIGDGNLKPMVLDAIRGNSLEPRVIDAGRTEQRAGARLLKAADIYVSPHSSHMVDSPFFGSPTKLFEYMALGGGIVASDLEQLGIVMSPALRPADFANGKPAVRDQRGVLCKPGDVEDFVAGVMALLGNLDIAAQLGRNARAAALAHYSWTRHVARIWDHVAGLSAGSEPVDQQRMKAGA